MRTEGFVAPLRPQSWLPSRSALSEVSAVLLAVAWLPTRSTLAQPSIVAAFRPARRRPSSPRGVTRPDRCDAATVRARPERAKVSVGRESEPTALPIHPVRITVHTTQRPTTSRLLWGGCGARLASDPRQAVALGFEFRSGVRWIGYERYSMPFKVTRTCSGGMPSRFTQFTRAISRQCRILPWSPFAFASPIPSVIMIATIA